MVRVLCALLVLGGCGDSKSAKTEAPATLAPLDKEPTLEMVYEVVNPTGQRSVDQAAKIVGHRIAAMGIERGKVFTAGRQVLVHLADVSEERASELRVRVVGDLAFRMVVPRTEYMRAAFAMANADKDVEGRTDVWSSTKDNHRDWFVVAETPEIINDFFARFTRETGRKLDADKMIAVERLLPRMRDRKSAKRWRSYVVAKKAELTGAAVKAASVVIDPQRQQPQVLIELTAEGQRKFEALTRANVGAKMAIFLGPFIKSAPVIRAPIPGGKAMVTMGGTDLDQMKREAQDLVAVLRSGSLPQPLRLVRVNTLR